MKKIYRNKKIIKIIIYTVLILAVQFFILGGRIKININESARRFFIAVEIILSVLLLKTLVSFILKDTLLPKNVKDFMGKAFRKLFRPILNKIRELHNRRRKFIKGTDEEKIIFNLNIIDKLKDKFRLREKLKLKHGDSNAEKIRLLYIKLILLLEKDYVIKYSYTPKEIKETFDYKSNDILCDIYEQVRYGRNEDISVSDDIVELCENGFK